MSPRHAQQRIRSVRLLLASLAVATMVLVALVLIVFERIDPLGEEYRLHERARHIGGIGEPMAQLREGFVGTDPPECTDCPVYEVPLSVTCIGSSTRTRWRARWLAFEASGLLQVGGALDPPRFVMVTEVFKLAIGHWLLGRARGGYGAWGVPYGRQRFRRTYSASKARAREATALPPEQRAGVTFAANAWGFGGEVGALGWAPAATHEDDVVIEEKPSEGERISVPAMLPEGCLVAPKAEASVVRAPSAKRTRTETAPAKEAAPLPRRKATAKAPVASASAAREAPTGELMASELKAMGHTPTDVKRMLADGVLERAGFGWFRFTQRG